eukprot:425457-Hanusia_phi.AAC.1
MQKDVDQVWPNSDRLISVSESFYQTQNERRRSDDLHVTSSREEQCRANKTLGLAASTRPNKLKLIMARLVEFGEVALKSYVLEDDRDKLLKFVKNVRSALILSASFAQSATSGLPRFEQCDCDGAAGEEASPIA